MNVVHEVQGPDGRIHEVEGPDTASPESIVAIVRQQLEADERLANDTRLSKAMKGAPGLGENIMSGLGAGFTGTLESGALGIAALLDEKKELAARETIQDVAAKFTPDGGDRDSLSYGLANAIGSIGGFAAPAALAGLAAPIAGLGAATVGTAAAAGLGVATQAGEASERARMAGATEDQRNQAIRYTAPVGLTEVLPLGKLAKQFDKPIFHDLLNSLGKNALKGIRGRIASAASTGGLEAAQEVAQELVQNMAEKNIYNPSKELMDNLGPAAGYGGGAGAIMQGVLDLFVPAKYRRESITDAVTEAKNQQMVNDAIGPQEELFDNGPYVPPLDGAQGDLFPAGSRTQPEVSIPDAPVVNENQRDMFNEPPTQPDMVDLQETKQIQEMEDQTELELLIADIEESDRRQAIQDKQNAALEKARAETLRKNKIIEETATLTPQEIDNQLKQSIQLKEDKAKLDAATAVQLAGQATARPITVPEKAPKVTQPELTPQEASDQLKQSMQEKAASDREAQARDIAETDRRVAEEQNKRTIAARRVILDNILATNSGKTPVAAIRNFTNTLVAGNFKDAIATADEVAVVKAVFEENKNEQQPRVDQTGNRDGATDTTPTEEAAAVSGPATVTKTEEPATGSVGLPEQSNVAAEVREGDGDTTLGFVADATETAPKIKSDYLDTDISKDGSWYFGPTDADGFITERTQGGFKTEAEAVTAGEKFVKNSLSGVGSLLSGKKDAPTTEAESEATETLSRTERNMAAQELAATLAGKSPKQTYKGWVIDPETSQDGGKYRVYSNDPAFPYSSTAQTVADAKKQINQSIADGPEANVVEEVEKAAEEQDATIAEAQPDLAKTISDAIEAGITRVLDAQEKKTKPRTEQQKREDSQADLLKKGTTVFGSGNKTFTPERVDAILAKNKTLKSLGPEQMIDALYLAGFYIEGGARSFIDYTAKMIEAYGNKITDGQLKKLYNQVREENEFEGMNTAEEVADDITQEDRATIDAMTTAQKEKISVAGGTDTDYTKINKLKQTPNSKLAATATTGEMGVNPYLSENPKELVPVSDYTTVVKLLQTADSKLDKAGKAAKTYFNDDRRVIDNLTDIAYDSSHYIDIDGTAGVRVSKYNIPSALLVYAGKIEADTIQENAFMKQKGGSAADLALEWVRDNLSKDATVIINKKWSAHFKEYITLLKVDPVTYMTKSEQRKYDKTDEGKVELAHKEALAAEKAMNRVIASMPLIGEIKGGEVTTPSTFEAGDQALIEEKAAANKRQKSAKEAEDELVADQRAAEQNYDELIDVVDKGLTKEDKVDKARDDYIDLVEGGKATKKQLKQAFAKLNGLLELPYYAIESTDLAMHPQVRRLISAGDLKGALEIAANTNPNKMVRRFASAISEKIGDTKIKMVRGLKNDSGRRAGGHFDPKTNTISINADESVPTHVLLHEAAHAVLSHTIENNPSHPAVKQLQALYDSVKDDLRSHYGTESLQEFVAEAMSNPLFQQELASLYASRKSNKTALQQLRDIFRNFFNKLRGIQSTGSQAQLNDLLIGLMSPAPASRNAGVLQSLHMMGLEEQNAKILEAARENREVEAAAQPRLSQKGIVALVKKLLTEDIPSGAQLAVTGLFPSYQMANATSAFGIEGSHAIHHAFNAYDASINILNSGSDTFVKVFREWRAKATPHQALMFNNLRALSTRKGVHPGKEWKTDSKGKFLLDKDGNKQKRYAGDKLRLWNDMQAGWELIGEEGRENYEMMRNQYVEAYERLKENLLSAIAEVTTVDGVVQVALRESLQGKIFKDLLGGTDIDPYFPLYRAGKHWVEYSADLDGQNETVYEIFPDAASRDKRYADLKAIQDGDAKNNPAKIGYTGPVRQYETSDFTNFDKVPPTAFVKESLDIMHEMKVDETTKEMLIQLFINRLPESSFAKKVQARTGDIGFEMDSLETFQGTIYDLNRQTMQLKHGRLIRKAHDAFAVNAKAFSNKHQEDALMRQAARDLEREWKMRVDFAINPDASKVATAARTVNRIAFTGTIGFSFSSAMVNLSQIPMVVYPYLAGKTDIKTATKALKDATFLVMNAGKLSLFSYEHIVRIEGEGGIDVKNKSFAPSVDNYYILDQKTGKLNIRDDLDLDATTMEMVRKIQPMVQFMSDNSQLSRSLLYDTLGAELSGKNQHGLDKASAYSAWMFHITERTNRQIAMVGAYLNELARLDNNPNTELDGEKSEVGLTGQARIDRAIKNAFDDAQYTNGGAVLATAPRWAQKSIGRVAMMFKSYGVTMYIMQAKTFMEMIKGKTAYEKRVAKRQFFGVQGAVALMAGVQGLTLYGLYAWVHNALFRDDDEEDFETSTRKFLGEGVWKGGLNQITRALGGEGVDIAARIGLANLLIGSDKYNFDPSPEKSIIKALGGPAWGYGSQVWRGFGNVGEGEYWRGVENMLPAAFRNAMKAARYTDEGEIRSRRGDPIMGELGYGLLAAQVLGFAPAEYTRNQERAQSLKGIDRPSNERRTKLLWLLYRAERFGEDVTGIRGDIEEFNQRHPDNAIDGKAIRNSRKRHMETDQKMFDGVLLSPNKEDTLRDLASDWDQGLQLFK